MQYYKGNFIILCYIHIMSKSISVNGHWYHQQLHNQCIFSMNAVLFKNSTNQIYGPSGGIKKTKGSGIYAYIYIDISNA